MCLICGNLEELSIPHLLTEARSLSNSELVLTIDLLKKHQNNANSKLDPVKAELNNSILRKTILALLAIKARKGIN